jgi:hypothetical protein
MDLDLDRGSIRARRLRAKYAFSGAGAEIDKTLPLKEGEEVLIKGRAMESYGAGLRRLVAVRLTTRRLAVLRHHALKSDRVVEIPAGALLTVDSVDDRIALKYRGSDGEPTPLVLGGSTGPRTRILDPLFRNPENVISTFRQWLEANPPG